MRLGYACINETLGKTFRSCRVATVEKLGIDVIKERTLENIKLTKEIIEWNISNEILFYRLTSDIVVLATHPINTWDWRNDQDFLKICSEINELQKNNNLRLTMHPGQYDVLNSPNNEVVKKTKQDLMYHNDLLNLVGGTDIILHLGGKYGDKENALKRLIDETNSLSLDVKQKLRFENDDKVYTVTDALFISEQTKIPVCFDIHHHFCNPTDEDLKCELKRVWKSWEGFGIPKVHISSGRESKVDRRHHELISSIDFDQLLIHLNGQDVDVMIEAKSKDKALLNLINYRIFYM
jgi:UV DNA damage endonuclease